MLASTANCTPNLLKYYVFATISFLVAVSFHCSVYNRFGAFEQNLKEATDIKYAMEWDELKAFDYFLKSVQLHRQGIHDTIEAYEYEYAAILLNASISEEEQDLDRLRKEAQELEQQAASDQHMSAMDGMSSFRNDRAYVGSKIAGIHLAQQAKDENERSEELMNQTARDEARGKEELQQAREALARAELAQNSTALDKGICKWAAAICNAIRSNGGRKNNQTVVANPSDAVIQANGDIQKALQRIREAEEERSLAIDLHRNASIHANLSTALLQDAKAFSSQSELDLKLSKEYRQKAEEEQAEAERDEALIQEEQADIALKEAEIQNDTEKSTYMFHKVASDRSREARAIQKMSHELEFVERRHSEWEQKMNQARNHVSRAGWEALVALVSALCLLVLVSTRIIATFRYQRPLRWILREPPFWKQDAWYLVCHLSIFVLALSYVGELLRNFHNQTNLSRAGITFVFSLSAAFLQVTLLHFLPAVDQLYRESRLNFGAIRVLVKTTIFQKGTIIALVSAIEMLLCWCWMGTYAFTQVHKLNNVVVWLVVLCESVGYGLFLRTQEHASAYVPTNCSTGEVASIPSHIVINDEQNSLLGPSYSTKSQGYVPGIQSPSTGTPPSMQSIPLGGAGGDDGNYGSLSQFFRSYLSTSPLAFSWKSDLVKVRLLLEFWLASLALWIVHRDRELIRKLSPLATGLVWGVAPLWILNICLFLILATLVVLLANVKLRR